MLSLFLALPVENFLVKHIEVHTKVQADSRTGDVNLNFKNVDINDDAKADRRTDNFHGPGL